MQPMPSVTPMSTERPFPRGQVVVCQYDFNFHLTYVNPAFARSAAVRPLSSAGRS